MSVVLYPREMRRRPRCAASSGFTGYAVAMADEQQQPLSEQLKEIGVQLDWVRDYL